MNQPEPQSRPFETIISQIKNGVIKIPQFQRDFVWTRQKSANLLDSILKGYPIGTFILWRTKEQLRTVRNLGGAKLPDTPHGDYAQQVLDGQQRLTSLYAAINGLQVKRNGNIDDFGQLFINLIAASDSEQSIVVTDPSSFGDKNYIALRELHEGGFRGVGGIPQTTPSKTPRVQRATQILQFLDHTGRRCAA